MEADTVFAEMTQRQMRKGETLIMARDFADRVGFVWDGAYSIIMASPPARTFCFVKLRRGGTFGQAQAFTGHFGEGIRLQCNESGMVLEVDFDRYAALRRSIPALAEATLAFFSRIAVDQSARIYELAVLNARERIQAELLRLARDGDWRGRRSLIYPAPTHQELADQVGAAREVVTRCLRALAEAGLIRMENRSIEILDIDRMLELDTAATGRVLFDPAKYAQRA